jgi:DNA-binding beta-propeller fold protein YncE
MSLKIGTTGIGAVNVGSQGMKKIYSGSQLVWEKIGEIELTYDNYSAPSVDSIPQGASIHQTLNKLYLAGEGSDRIYRFSINPTTGNLAYDNYSIDIVGIDTLIESVAVHNTKNKLYMLGRSNNRIYRFSIDGSGNLTYDNYFVATTGGTPQGIAVHSSLNYLYEVREDNDRISRYTIDGSGNLTWNSLFSFDISGQDGTPTDMDIDETNNKLHMIGNVTDKIYRYSVGGTGGLTYDELFWSVSASGNIPQGVATYPSLSKVYISDSTQDKIFRYSL